MQTMVWNWGSMQTMVRHARPPPIQSRVTHLAWRCVLHQHPASAWLQITPRIHSKDVLLRPIHG